MQTLWSRAGQAHRCGCRACETVVSNIGRRVTTAAQPRKVTFAEIFTACYSSIFATAAVVDAMRKEDRRQELDRQLEATRREVASLQLLREKHQAAAAIDPAQDELTLGQMDHLWKALKDIYTNRPYMKEIDKPVTIRVSEFLKRLQADHYECPDEATMNTLRRTNYERLEQAIMREETDQTLPHRGPTSTNQHHNDERTVFHLVKQLLERAEAHDRSKSPSPSYDEAFDIAYNKHSNYLSGLADPDRMRMNRRNLNQHIRQTIDSTNLNLKEMVGRVCYNLLVSAYSADMHTYNTLIVAFDKRGLKNLAEPVVNSFYYYRRLQPTPSTFVAILNHYKNSGNHGRFLRALACLTGLDTETGAKLKRRPVDGGTEKRDKRNKIKTWTRTGDWVWKHASLDRALVESVIEGLLRFKLFDQAANFFVTCMKAKVVLGAEVIRQLFDECIVALDWKAAVRLVQGFSNYPTVWPSMLLSQNEDASYLISRMHVLLDLAGLRGSGDAVSKPALDNLFISSEGFGRFLNNLAMVDSISHLNLEDSSVEPQDLAVDLVSSSKSRLLQIEALWKEQAFVGSTTKSIESKFLYPDFSPQFRRSMALHIGNTAAEQTAELNGEILDVLTQLPLSREVEQTLAECKSFRDMIVVANKIKKTRRLVADGLPPSKAKAPEPIAQEYGQLMARPSRLTTWPVPDQPPAYWAQTQWA
ncbi:hypothetical protein FSARC_63 [Fusarium sarcochroum]|uniref:Pentatricopeptide repeat domain-containing protein n=1 Tax=Fusarium sarcochroum TaxID=1208366 RepID=A0A8H4UC94_9HYPO|nr:hypothetical protein FSARC_63 [Fusarium sarcochroum]